MIHGEDGEDGKIPYYVKPWISWYQVPIFATACPLYGQKIRTKAVWRTAGIPMAKDLRHIPFHRKIFMRLPEKITSEKTGFPAVVKNSKRMIGNGIYIVRHISDLEAVSQSFRALQRP